MRRHELGDEDWAFVQPLLPKQRCDGKWNVHRTMLSAMMWILQTGEPRRDLSEHFGEWQSAYDCFNRWRLDGAFGTITKVLRIRPDEEGKIDWDLWRIGGIGIRSARLMNEVRPPHWTGWPLDAASNEGYPPLKLVGC